jgi:hypothetical protein
MRVEYGKAGHGGQIGAQNFRFRVRAIGGCGGNNPYSNVLHVCLTQDPPIMPTVTTETVGCAVRINIGDAVGGSQPDEIRIQIQGSDYQYYADNLPCSTSGNSRECVVHQDILKSHPYNLRPGHLVIVRCAGRNDAGWGAYSGPNTVGAPIASVPYKLGAPTLVEKTSNSISLTWPRYYGSHAGQSFDHDYQLQWCPPPVNPADKCEWTDLRYTSGTTYTHKNLSHGKLYKYRVRATCVCEEAQWSEEFCQELQAPPDKPNPACPSPKDQCMDFLVQWTPLRQDEYDQGVQMANNYKIEVKTADD